jgi:ATP-dependent DNA ligase
VLYLDHFAGDGVAFFRAARRADAEGIVGKYADGIYQSGGLGTSWSRCGIRSTRRSSAGRICSRCVLV